MNIVFYIISTLEIIELIYAFKRTKQLLSIHNVFFVSIVINFFLYLQNWSTDFITDCSTITYTVIVFSQITVMLYDLIYMKRISRVTFHSYDKKELKKFKSKIYQSRSS